MTGQQQHDFEPRRAEPGQTFATTDAEGREISVKADDDGVVWPQNATEAKLLEPFDLPVARKAMREVERASSAAAAADDKPTGDKKTATAADEAPAGGKE